jgi:amino acid efflux transporter
MTALADPVAEPTTGRLGLGSASALYIAAVLGTGILALPGLAANAAGPASIVAVVAVLIASIPLAGTFAALAARYPDAGGVATFVRLALGPTAARMSGYWFFFGVSFGAPVVAILGGEYVVAALGAERSLVPVVGFAFLAMPLAVNVVGLRMTGRIQLGLTALLLLVVIGVVWVSVPAVEPGNFSPFLPNGWAGVGLATSLFVWAFAGWEAVTHIAGEFRSPRRTIPVATAVAVIVVGAAYLALQVVTVGVLGSGRSDSPVPLIDLVSATVPGLGPAVVAVIAGVVAVGVLNTYIPAFANLAASLGRDGHLPHFFAAGAAPGSVPRRALALWSVLGLGYFGLMVVTGLQLEPFILIHTSSMVAVYALGMIAAVRLLERGSVGWWMAVASVVLVAGLLVLAGTHLLVPAVLAVVAVIVTLAKRATLARERSTAAH